MFYNIYRRLRRKKVAAVNPQVNTDTPEVKIPVGGITEFGTIYENKVYPDGKDELLYKEQRIDDPKKEEKSNTNNS